MFCLVYELPGKDILNRQRKSIYADSNCEVVTWLTMDAALSAAEDLANKMNTVVHVCTMPVAKHTVINNRSHSHEHEWVDTYYGVECKHCKLFYPSGSEPWLQVD